MKTTLALILCLMLSGAALAEQPAKAGNVLSTESVEAKAGTSFSVKVNLSSVDTMVAIQVPIYFRSETTDLTCDSVSFLKTRLQDQSMSFSRIDSVGKVVFFAFMAMTQTDPQKPMLNPGDGPIGIIWFTAKKDIKPGTVTLESGPNAYLAHEFIDYSYHFWKMTPEDLTKDVDCTFKPGTITIK